MRDGMHRSEQATPSAHGELLHLTERVVVSRERGRFRPPAQDVVGTLVTEGQIIGMIDQREESRPVVSLFRGHLIDMLVSPGELVREGQPIAWLRVA